MANTASVGGSGTTRSNRDRWSSGVAGGVLGALVMGLFFMLVSAMRGLGFWTPMKLISAVFLGTSAVFAGAGAVVLGLIVHLLVGAALGVLYAYMIPKEISVGLDVLMGLAFGALVYFVMTYAVLPWVNPLMFAAVSRGWFFVYHLAFGLTLSLVVPVRRGVVSRAPRTRERWSTA